MFKWLIGIVALASILTCTPAGAAAPSGVDCQSTAPAGTPVAVFVAPPGASRGDVIAAASRTTDALLVIAEYSPQRMYAELGRVLVSDRNAPNSRYGAAQLTAARACLKRLLDRLPAAAPGRPGDPFAAARLAFDAARVASPRGSVEVYIADPASGIVAGADLGSADIETREARAEVVRTLAAAGVLGLGVARGTLTFAAVADGAANGLDVSNRGALFKQICRELAVRCRVSLGAAR